MIAASDDDTCCSPAAISGNGIAISNSEHARPPGEREEHDRCEHDARPRHEGGRHSVVDRDLDEQVRDPP
jgi:hypothetical protein